jgi:FkbM family methyltransferase
LRLRSAIASALVSAYGHANRLGVFANPAARSLFVRSYFAYKRFVEDPFASLVRKRPELFAGGHVLDVGANVGYTAAVFARALSPGFKVFAFEPEQRNFEDLERTVSRRSLEGLVVPVHAAVGEKEGDVELWCNDAHHADHRIATEALRASGLPVRKTIRLPMVSIDGFLREHRIAVPIKFVKIDVQGYELAVCEGMLLTIGRNPDMAIAVEYSPAALKEMGHEPARLLAFFSGHGYATRILRAGGELLPADRDSLERIVAQAGYVDVLCMPLHHR